MNEENKNAPLTEPEAAPAKSPLEFFQEVANNLITDRSKDPTTKAAIAYGYLNSLARQGVIQPEMLAQLFGSFMIANLNLAC